MIFLLDENFPKSADKVLSELGHQVIDIREVAPRGTNDFDLFAIAQQHRAVVLTTDRDFYHTVPLRHVEHFGVIVIALRQPNRSAILNRLRWIVAQDIMHEIYNTVVLLRDTTYRVRYKRSS